MPNRYPWHTVAAIFGLVLAFQLGCADGPFHRMWYRKQWLEDEQYGATLHTRLEQLAEVREESEDLEGSEQARIAANLTQALQDEQSPQYRSALVRTLGTLATPAALEGLRIAQRDPEPSVRVTACAAWGTRGGSEAVSALSDIIQHDDQLDVRIAAARELGNFKDQEAIPALGLALDSPDPALQHRAVQSLREVTGRDYGNSIPAWRQFVQNGDVEAAEEISIAERFRSLF